MTLLTSTAGSLPALTRPLALAAYLHRVELSAGQHVVLCYARSAIGLPLALPAYLHRVEFIAPEFQFVITLNI